MLKCVMFDWGGTLSDDKAFFEGVNRKVSYPFLQRLGFKGSFDEYEKVEEMTARDMLESWRKNKKFKRSDWPMFFAKNAGLEISEEDANKEFEAFMEYYVNNSKLFPEAINVLQFVRKNGLKLALISDNWVEAHLLFNRLGVKTYFDIVVLSEEMGALKYHLEPFEFAMEKLGLMPEDCLMVGNQIEDDGACKRLGIDFCLLDMENKHEKDAGFDFRIKTLEELKGIIASLL